MKIFLDALHLSNSQFTHIYVTSCYTSRNNKFFFFLFMERERKQFFWRLREGFVLNVCKFYNLRPAICFDIEIATHLESQTINRRHNLYAICLDPHTYSNLNCPVPCVHRPSPKSNHFPLALFYRAPISLTFMRDSYRLMQNK